MCNELVLITHSIKNKQATVDHFIPKNAGSEPFNIKNFVISCGKCNGEKGKK